MMEERGLTLPLLIDTIRDATQATKTSNAAILLTKDGKTIKAEEQGLIEIPDHFTRLKAVEIAGKWLGIDKPNIIALKLEGDDMKVEFYADENKT